MGIWESLYSTMESVKRRCPDPAPVKEFCGTAYGLGRSAVGAIGSATVAGGSAALSLVSSAAAKVRGAAPDLSPAASAVASLDQAVRVEGARRVREAVADPDVRAKAGRIGLKIADKVIDHVSRPYTGGIPVYSIAKSEWVKGAAHGGEGEGRELEELRKRLERLEEAAAAAAAARSHSDDRGMVCAGDDYGSHGGVQLQQKPEDVIRVFLMKGVNGGDFMGEQVWQQAAKLRRDILLSAVY